MTRGSPRFSLIAALVLLAGAGVRAEEPAGVLRPAAQAPRGVDALLAAIAGDDGALLLKALPEEGRVELFGRKLDRARIESELKLDAPVTTLLHWPRGADKPLPPGPLLMRIVSRSAGEVQVRPLGAQWPLCTLRSVSEAPFRLVGCVEASAPKQ